MRVQVRHAGNHIDGLHHTLRRHLVHQHLRELPLRIPAQQHIALPPLRQQGMRRKALMQVLAHVASSTVCIAWTKACTRRVLSASVPMDTRRQWV